MTAVDEMYSQGHCAIYKRVLSNITWHCTHSGSYCIFCFFNHITWGVCTTQVASINISACGHPHMYAVSFSLWNNTFTTSRSVTCIQGLAQVSTWPTWVSTLIHFTVCNSMPHTHTVMKYYMCRVCHSGYSGTQCMQWQIPHTLISLLCQFQLSFSYKIQFHLVIIFNRHGRTDDNLIMRAYTLSHSQSSNPGINNLYLTHGESITTLGVMKWSDSCMDMAAWINQMIIDSPPTNLKWFTSAPVRMAVWWLTVD